MQFTRKHARGAVITIVIIAAIAGAAWLRLSQPHVRELVFQPTDYTGWQTYHDEALGLSLKYPPGFVVYAPYKGTLYEKTWSDFYVLTGNFKREQVPRPIDVTMLVGVVSTTQPVAYQAPVFANIQDLFFSDIAYPPTHKQSPGARLVILNGYDAIFRMTDVVDDIGGVEKGEEYTIMRNGRVLTIGIVKGSPYHDGVMQSIQFDK